MRVQKVEQVKGRDVYGVDDEKIGTVGRVYLVDETGEPAWAIARTGLLGAREVLLPMFDAELLRDRVTVPYTKGFVENAPEMNQNGIDENGHLAPDLEQELRTYYGRVDFEMTADEYEAGRTGRGTYEGRRTGRGIYEAERTGRSRSRTTGHPADRERYASQRTDRAETVSVGVDVAVPLERVGSDTVTDRLTVAEKAREAMLDVEAHTRGYN